MQPIKVEIDQYRELENAGALKATFTLVEYPTGRKTRKCKYFATEDQRWWTFPQELIEYKDGRKSDYIPYVSYIDKEYSEQLKIEVLKALKDAKPEQKNGKVQNQTNNRPGAPRTVPAKSPSDWEGSPF